MRIDIDVNAFVINDVNDNGSTAGLANVDLRFHAADSQ
jgi:hypothetical protein